MNTSYNKTFPPLLNNCSAHYFRIKLGSFIAELGRSNHFKVIKNEFLNWTSIKKMVKTYHQNWFYHFSQQIHKSESIYKFGSSVCLFVCLSVCLLVSNKRQNGWTDRAQISCGTSKDPREGLRMIKISNICLHQNSIFI